MSYETGKRIGQRLRRLRRWLRLSWWLGSWGAVALLVGMTIEWAFSSPAWLDRGGNLLANAGVIMATVAGGVFIIAIGSILLDSGFGLIASIGRAVSGLWRWRR